MEKEYPGWINVTKTYSSCPHCARGVLSRRIKRGFLFKTLLVWMDIKRYQCNVCGRKVYLSSNHPKHELLKNQVN